MLSIGGAAAEGGRETVFALDVDAATDGVQTSSESPVAVGETLHVRAVLESLGADVYGAYQVTITYDADTLEPAGLPENWGDAPTAESGGNLLAFSSGSLCDPSPTANSIGPVVQGVGSLGMTCAERDFSQTTSNTGDLVDVVFRCIAPGATTLGLSSGDDTFLLDARVLATPDAGIYSDERGSATVTCEGDALSPTPAADGSATQPPAGTAVAGGSATVSPQETPSDGASPSGGSDDDDGAPWALIAVIAVIAVGAVGAGAAYALRRGAR